MSKMSVLIRLILKNFIANKFCDYKIRMLRVEL